jgi:hypothetical protein
MLVLCLLPWLGEDAGAGDGAMVSSLERAGVRFHPGRVGESSGLARGLDRGASATTSQHSARSAAEGSGRNRTTTRTFGLEDSGAAEAEDEADGAAQSDMVTVGDGVTGDANGSSTEMRFASMPYAR